MVDEQKYETSFETISYAGGSKSASFEALALAKLGKFDEAEAQLAEARRLMNEAHNLQTAMITEEARGNSVEVNIILVHAQDHLSMAQTALDFAEEFVTLYKTLFELKEAK